MPTTPNKPRRKRKVLLLATGSFVAACSADTDALGIPLSPDAGAFVPYDAGFGDLGRHDAQPVDTGLPPLDSGPVDTGLGDLGPQLVDAGAIFYPDAADDDAGVIDDAEPGDGEARD
jgi:hypothetical protein